MWAQDLAGFVDVYMLAKGCPSIDRRCLSWLCLSFQERREIGERKRDSQIVAWTQRERQDTLVDHAFLDTPRQTVFDSSRGKVDDWLIDRLVVHTCKGERLVSFLLGFLSVFSHNMDVIASFLLLRVID